MSISEPKVNEIPSYNYMIPILVKKQKAFLHRNLFVYMEDKSKPDICTLGFTLTDNREEYVTILTILCAFVKAFSCNNNHMAQKLPLPILPYLLFCKYYLYNAQWFFNSSICMKDKIYIILIYTYILKFNSSIFNRKCKYVVYLYFPIFARF